MTKSRLKQLLVDEFRSVVSGVNRVPLRRFHNALVSCYILRAKLLFGLKRFEEVLTACARGCQIHRQNPFFCLYKGRVLYCLNQFAEAIEAFKTSAGQFEEARKADETGILYQEDLYSTYIELGRACEAQAEQEKQKWLQRRDEAQTMAQKLKNESKQKRHATKTQQEEGEA